jgi:ribosome-associated protein
MGAMTGAGDARAIEIRDDVVRLGQLLKLADVVDAGGDVKALLASGQVTVNGEAETRRGRQLRRGDVVDAAGQRLTIA